MYSLRHSFVPYFPHCVHQEEAICKRGLKNVENRNKRIKSYYISRTFFRLPPHKHSEEYSQGSGCLGDIRKGDLRILGGRQAR
jgi:hypothetical protein